MSDDEDQAEIARPVDRVAIGSLAGRVDLASDWDAPETNAEVADDFYDESRPGPT
jgi:hypothetical protein